MRIKKSSSVEKPKYIDKVSNRLVIIQNKNNPPSNFFVPAHPVIALLVPYGLLLTFSAALFPENISSFVPLGELAKYLGNEFSVLMQFLALFAASVHAAYPFYIVTLSKRYQLRLKQTILWAINGFFFGIFAIWPLVFYDLYVENEAMYCNIPLAMCWNKHTTYRKTCNKRQTPKNIINNLKYQFLRCICQLPSCQQLPIAE